MTTIALVAAVAVCRVVTALVFSAALGALTAGALSWMLAVTAGAGTAWAVNVTVLAGEVAAIGLVAAVMSMRRVFRLASLRASANASAIVACPGSLICQESCRSRVAYVTVHLLKVAPLMI